MQNLQLYTRFINKMYDVSNAIHQYESIPRTYGSEIKLYMKEMHTLARIYEEPGSTLSEIADIENKTRSCLSQRINRLVKKGLIQKIKNQDEYKKTNLFVTDRGRMVAEYHARLDERNYSRVMEHLNQWSEHEFEKYIELLNIIEDSVLSDC